MFYLFNIYACLLLIYVDMKGKINWALWFSVVAVILSIIAIAVAVYRSPELGFDYQGVLVGVLSLLVTVLVGLNIYTLVDFRRKENVIDEKVALIAQSLSNINKSELASSAAMENAIAFIYYSLMGLKDPSDLDFRYIYHNILSLEKLSLLGDIKTCNSVVKMMLETIVHPERISVSKKNKEQLYVWLSKVKDTEQIERFGELIECIAKINSV